MRPGSDGACLVRGNPGTGAGWGSGSNAVGAAPGAGRSRALARLLLCIPLLSPAAACGYNRIQELDERVAETRANIEAELVRRNDLIPNLVATVDEAAEFEQRTFTQVAQARAGLTQAREQVGRAVEGGAPPDELAGANATLSENLRLFLNVAVEAYPTLRANRNFVGLQDELTATENRIAVARRDYNEAVRTYNTFIRQFPQVITARVIGAEPQEPFEAPTGVERPPAVEFEPEQG